MNNRAFHLSKRAFVGLSLALSAFGCKKPSDDSLESSNVGIVQQAITTAWAAGTRYAVGSLVTFNGITYQCRQLHTSQVGWEPPNVPSLWTRPTPSNGLAWTTQTHYVVGSQVTFGGALYQCIQEHFSQNDWTPTAAPTLWSCANAACGNPAFGLTPTLNCVATIGPGQLAAVFGYSNATGGNVTVGAGSHNGFSPGATDRGQPISFVPGAVPIATIQPFASAATLTYVLGSASVTASSSSPACPADMSTAVGQVYTDNGDSRAVRQSVTAIIANPNFLAWLNAGKGLGSQITAFESSLLDAGILAANNADLLGDPGALTSAQRNRLPGFLTSILTNPAVTAMRLAGDALKGNSTSISCNAISALNGGQSFRPIVPPQPGSLYERALSLSQSQELGRLQTTLGNVAAGTQNRVLLGASGLIIAATLPADQLIALQLSGTIPTGFLDVVKGVVIGAVVGAVAGAASGGAYGAVVGAVVGGVIGGVIGAVDPDAFGGDCQQCTGGASDPGTCGMDDHGNVIACVGGCCPGSNPPLISINFLKGTSCPNSGPSCNIDADCATGLTCLQNCCINTATFCANSVHCSVDSDCATGNTCHFGCCVGHCGLNGVACDTLMGGPTCRAPVTCNVGVCSNGCCAIP